VLGRAVIGLQPGKGEVRYLGDMSGKVECRLARLDPAAVAAHIDLDIDGQGHAGFSSCRVRVRIWPGSSTRRRPGRFAPAPLGAAAFAERKANGSAPANIVIRMLPDYLLVKVVNSREVPEAQQ